MMKWTLALAAALLVPSVAHAQDLGTCYSNGWCVQGTELAREVTFDQCGAAGGSGWLGDYNEFCTNIYAP